MKGEFKNGDLNRGKKPLKTEKVSEGSFFHGLLLDGQGKKTKSDGTVELGEFKLDHLHGQGKEPILMEQLRKGNLTMESTLHRNLMEQERKLMQMDLSLKVNLRMESRIWEKKSNLAE